MRAGTLRHRITIQEQTDTADGMGGFSTTWTDLFDMRVAIWPLSAKERLEAMKLGVEVTHKIRGRYRSGITPKNRIKFDTRIFNITSMINPDERNRTLDMLATEEI